MSNHQAPNEQEEEQGYQKYLTVETPEELERQAKIQREMLDRNIALRNEVYALLKDLGVPGEELDQMNSFEARARLHKLDPENPLVSFKSFFPAPRSPFSSP